MPLEDVYKMRFIGFRDYFVGIFFLFFIATQAFATSLQRENIPFFDPSASQIIPFSIQKNFKNGSLKYRFLKDLKSYFGIEIFVETGTNLGNTTAKASGIFTEVHTIELFPEFYSLALEKFKTNSNVHVYFGSSEHLLPSILPLCQQPTLFYLDGHYDGGDRSGKGEKNTPILEELAAIQAWGRTDAVIVIDDVCDFQESLYSDRIQQTCFADYPDLKQIVESVLAINPQYQICFIPNALLIFPPSPGVTVSPLLSACTIDRFSVFSPLFSEQELLFVEKTIGGIQGSERKELQDYFQAYAKFEWSLGWRSFAGLWMGLILSHDQKRSEAQQIFKQTKQSAIPGWRVDVYIVPS